MKALVVCWEWGVGKHTGRRFWEVHSTQDERIRDWPTIGLKAIGAMEVDVVEGQGLELLEAHAARR